MDEEGGRRGAARRAAVRDLDRQGRRRNPVAERRHPRRDQGAGRPDGAGADARGGDRDRCGGGRHRGRSSLCRSPAGTRGRRSAGRRAPLQRPGRRSAGAALHRPHGRPSRTASTGHPPCAFGRPSRPRLPSTAASPDSAADRLRNEVHAAGPQDRGGASGRHLDHSGLWDRRTRHEAGHPGLHRERCGGGPGPRLARRTRPPVPRPPTSTAAGSPSSLPPSKPGPAIASSRSRRSARSPRTT